MAVSSNTIKTRIQLKSDTEANWNKAGPKEGSNGFVPLMGELIVYTPDATHPFSRLKVGDGSTNVVLLPFVDAGTLNGKETEIIKKETFGAFPSPGSSTCLYIDLSTNKIYHYSSSGYTELCDVTYSAVKQNIKEITYWGPGKVTSLKINNNTLEVDNGIAPELRTDNLAVVTDITKEGVE